MLFRGLVLLFWLTNAHAGEINRDLEAAALKPSPDHHYAIHLLKPLPRRNSGCETIFRNGEALDSCDPNYGMDPQVDGVFRTYCEWNLNSHYQRNNSSHWLEPYFNPELITITKAKAGYHLTGNYSTVWDELRGRREIVQRWIELDFEDQISGSNLGTLKCYPSSFSFSNTTLNGEDFYSDKKSKIQNDKTIKSGISIGGILDQLKGYVEFIQTN